MTIEKLQILTIPEDTVILKPEFAIYDHKRLLEKYGMSPYEHEDFVDGNQVCYNEVKFRNGNSDLSVLSLTTRQRGIKGPTTLLFVPNGFENLGLVEKEVALIFLFMKNRGEINLRFEGGISAQRAVEMAAFIQKTRGNINILFSAYGANFNKKVKL